MTVNEMLASIGIGGARINICETEGPHPRGSELSGFVELIGGRVEQEIDRLSVKLVEFWEETKGTPTYPRGSKVEHARSYLELARGIRVQPGGRQEFSFLITIPDHVRLTQYRTFGSPFQGCRVDSEADIPFAANPRRSTVINVTIHREIQATQRAMELLGFSAPIQRQYTVPFSYERSNHAPPADLRDQVDLVTLDLKVSDYSVYGSVTINRHDTTLGERLSAIVGGNRTKCGITIPRKALLTTDGKPDPEGGVEYLKELIAENVSMPGDLSKRLLRPSSTPASDADKLLRPASHGGKSSKDLLRPADESDES